MDLYVYYLSHKLVVKTSEHKFLLFCDKIERDRIDVISDLFVAFNLLQLTVHNRLENQ